MIKLENVFVKKGNKNILDGCNFNFEKGKSYALVGEVALENLLYLT
ncbi:hypothetical protein UM876_14660 (plasmid) [Staphylococcus aureus]|nr:hypothetical protein UM876_14660 [Staphylococcus aureus]